MHSRHKFILACILDGGESVFYDLCMKLSQKFVEFRPSVDVVSDQTWKFSILNHIATNVENYCINLKVSFSLIAKRRISIELKAEPFFFQLRRYSK